ncbi:hypothetical protein NQ315_009617 [Exocentrus adspersus]|uniref:Disintegrin and metalloproteinase domain-containing protein 10 n=1 Tax=Exocentrus adspersus TaxID=1586481 RepID=A0AAV8WGV3_9CUCU|nr:hypothetical protein NQ315_009617 [Exocentrus adspersus]
MIGEGKVCPLLVLLDYSFLQVIHRGNINQAVAQVLTALEATNSIFRSTDFDNDGTADNVGFRIKYFIVIKSEESPMNLLPKYSPYGIDAFLYLESFAQYELLAEVCLGLAVTGFTFDANVLGVSYTSYVRKFGKVDYQYTGICNRPHVTTSDLYLNSLVLTGRSSNGYLLPRHIFHIVMAHEIGHSFGSGHDTTPECAGYLMAPSVPSDAHRKRFQFSKCSKRVILKTMMGKGHCFESRDIPFCGNEIIDENEICDCGTVQNCQSLDVCCIPIGRKDSCKVNKGNGIECHPSQGICCDSKCKYSDLSQFDLSCNNFDQICPCEESEPCKCGVGGECTENNTCSSEECTRIALSECDCPFNNKHKKCVTCCWFQDYCLPSVNASEYVINNNASLIATLLQSIGNVTRRSEKFGYYKLFCDTNNSNNSFCAELYFRETNPGEYCLKNGQVGVCSKKLQCVLHRPKQVFPSLHIYDENSSHKPLSLFRRTVMLLNFIVIFFILL